MDAESEWLTRNKRIDPKLDDARWPKGRSSSQSPCCQARRLRKHLRRVASAGVMLAALFLKELVERQDARLPVFQGMLEGLPLGTGPRPLPAQ